MMLSMAAVNAASPGPRTMQLRVMIQGQPLLFLVDSGSSSCFIDLHKASLLSGREQLQKPVSVKVARGDILQSTEYFPALTWTAAGHDFVDSFRILALNNYDGIIGHDWLAKHSPMLTHWSQQWLAIEKEGNLVLLHGETTAEATHALIELHLVQDSENNENQSYSSELQSILDKFATVFATPIVI